MIVEIGSYRGKSTCYLGEGSLKGHGARVYAVDPWSQIKEDGRFEFKSQRPAFDAQVKKMGLEEIIRPIEGFSVSVAQGWYWPVGLLYVDGSHSFLDVQADEWAWERHIVSGGWIVFDDYVNPRSPGVARFIDKEMKKSRLWTHWDFSCPPLAIAQKR